MLGYKPGGSLTDRTGSMARHPKPHVTRERDIKAFDPAVMEAMQRMQVVVKFAAGLASRRIDGHASDLAILDELPPNRPQVSSVPCCASSNTNSTLRWLRSKRRLRRIRSPVPSPITPQLSA